MKSILTKTMTAGFMLATLLFVSQAASAQCTADFTYKVSGSTVQFTDSSTSNSFLFYYWQFGDNTYSSAQNPSHTYQKSGTYTVCLYVYDSTKSCVDSTCKSVSVTVAGGGGGGAKCNASYTYSVQGLTAAFKNGSNGSSTCKYMWSFGDSSVSYSTHATHTYKQAGTYTVCLIMKGSNCTDTACQNVTVSSNANTCTASFKYSTSGNTVWVSNQSSAGQGNVAYTWNWGDGNTSTGQNPSAHNYTSNGTYTICLLLYNATTNCSDSTCQSVTVASGNGSCKAGYSDSATGQFSFSFTNTSNTLNSGTAKYYWNYGDGSAVDTTQDATHTFAKAGTYNVCLKVKDGNCYDIYCKSFTVGGSQSTCAAMWADSAVSGTNQVYFFDLSKYNQGTKPAFAWDFGDGNYSSAQNPNHTYAKAGTYHVCLTITDSARGCADTYCQYLTVGKANTQCMAKFMYQTQGLVAAFQNKSTGTNGNTTYSWDFGDGTTGTGTSATHTYSKSGTYTVCLTISDSICSDTFCANVYVGTKFWLKGVVSLGNAVAYPEYGKVWAIHYDSSAGTLTAIDSTLIDSTDKGKYAFYLTPGYYLVKAALESGDRNYKDYLPTYYNDKLHWDTANLVALFSNTQGIDIHLIQGQNPGGPGFIGGYTSQGANKSGAVGDPVEGVEIILYDNAKKPIAYTYSDANGKFSFNNLAYGTYEVHPELLGKASSPLMVTISAAAPSVGDVVVEVNTLYAAVSLGLKSIAGPTTSNIKLYPNPAGNVLTVQFANGQLPATGYQISDMAGKTLLQSAQPTVDIGQLAPGIYLLRVGNAAMKFVKE